MHTINYRPDIDGLRAFAVLSVIAFHIFPELLPGGFIGVDVFFVISGYLISAIIFSDLQNNKFNFSDFYVRRIKRIFPALLVILMFVLIAGWLILLPSEYSSLGKITNAATSFLANLSMYNDRAFAYFETSSDYKPLAHLWSLSVEEQFYIFYPICIFVLYKIRSYTLHFLLLALVLSFSLNIFNLTKNPKACFLFLPSRSWELLLGAILAYLTFVKPLNLSFLRDPARNLISIVGISLMLFAVLSFDDKAPFPGWLALLPTLGATLMLCSRNTWLNRVVFAHPTAVWIGLISYPLYLWHWPLFSFARILQGDDLSVSTRLIIIVSSFVLAAITTLLIERPLRKQPARIIYPLIILMLVIFAASLAIKRMYIEPKSAAMDPLIQKIDAANNDWQYPGKTFEALNQDKFPFNRYGQGKDVTVFFGDSNIEQYWPRIEKLMQDSSERYKANTVVFATRGGSMPVPGYGDAEFVSAAVDYIKSPEVKTVVLGAQWMGYLTGKDDHSSEKYAALKTLITDLKRLNKTVYLILNIPIELSQSPSGKIRRKLFKPWQAAMAPSFNKQLWLSESRAMTANLLDIASTTGAIVIDPVQQLCPQGQCIILDSEGNPCYKDMAHLTASYVREKAGFLDQILALKE